MQHSKAGQAYTCSTTTPRWEGMLAGMVALFSDLAYYTDIIVTPSTGCKNANGCPLLGAHHHLWLCQAGLQAVEVQVLVECEKSNARPFCPWQTVQAAFDGSCCGGHHARVHGRDADIDDKEVDWRHRRPHLQQMRNAR